MSFLNKWFESSMGKDKETTIKVEDLSGDALTHTRILHQRSALLQPIDKIGLIKIQSEEDAERELSECRSKYETLSTNYKRWKVDGINVPPQYLVRSIFETEVCDKLLCIHASTKMKVIRKNYVNYLGEDLIKRLKERTILPKDNDKIVDSLWNFSNNVTEQSIHEADLSIRRQCNYYVDHLGRYLCSRKSNKICINEIKDI